jgi:hypothetical protein
VFRKLIFGSFLIVLFVSTSFSQSKEGVSTNGYFLEDSIKIGVSTPYVLTAKYPVSMDVIFPDSLFDFSPYELDEKLYFPTRSDVQYSYDSAVYYLTSFEIDSIQYYQMPAFIITGKDSVRILANIDSIYLQQMVSQIPDSLTAETITLLENTSYKTVNLDFNYPYLIIGVIILVILLISTYIFFGKSIKKWFVLRRLNKKFGQYVSDFDVLLKEENSQMLYEKTLQLWKKYHETLEGKPYTKLTTKELSYFSGIENIKPVLKDIDRAIYGKFKDTDKNELQKLKSFSQKRFEEKVAEVKNG